MKPIAIVLIAVAALATGHPGSAADAISKPVEVSIPFVNMGSIETWTADGSNALYIQDLHRRWYHATLMGSCPDLPFATAIGIETRGTDTLDRFGTIIVRHRRCAIQSLVASVPPQKKAKKKG